MNFKGLITSLILILVIHSCKIRFTELDSTIPEGTPGGAVDNTIFPADNIWNTPVNTLPVHPNSSSYINTIGTDTFVHPDFGSGQYQGAPIGIPYVTVGSDQPFVNISFTYDEESDPSPYPIPDNAPIEGGYDSTGDRHILIINTDTSMLYEIYAAYPQQDGSWLAGSGAVYDLTSNELRPAGWTSADAAGLPIFPGLVRYEEIEEGIIDHAIRFTLEETQRSYIWPARHYASTITNTDYPPMGLRLRLKSEFDISGYSETNRIILTAMKTYGLILADNGSSIFISGSPDEGWDNDDLRALRNITADDLEAVDVSSLMIDADSGEAIQP